MLVGAEPHGAGVGSVYVVRMEPGVWTPEETLAGAKARAAICAWLLVQVVAAVLGMPSRFVSGYLIQLVGGCEAGGGARGADGGFFATCMPGRRCTCRVPAWVGSIPTSGLMAGEGHIPLAATPDPQSAAPISGLVEPCEIRVRLRYETWTRVRETPRVTKPFTRGAVAGRAGDGCRGGSVAGRGAISG